MKINKYEKNKIKNKIKNKTENYDNIIFDNWSKKDFIEENTNPIVSKQIDYSVMSYCMWINVKNYLEKCSTNDNNDKNNKGEQKLKIKNINIYMCIIFNKIHYYQKNNNLLNNNLLNKNLLNNNLLNKNLLNKNFSMSKIIIYNTANYFKFLSIKKLIL